MLFPPVTKVVFAADSSGLVKAKLRPCQAAHDVKRKKARKISDNLIQYKSLWVDKLPINLTEDDVVLLGTVSRYTKKSGWFKVDNPEIVAQILRHNGRIISHALSRLYRNERGMTAISAAAIMILILLLFGTKI